MIGYSDSNKDVGYVASGWAAYRAQVAHRPTCCAATAATWVFFHGRGGAVGRGGGPDERRDPRPARRGRWTARLKMTEQGEVLARQVRDPGDRPPRARAGRERDAGHDPARRAADRPGPPGPLRGGHGARWRERSARAYRALVHERPAASPRSSARSRRSTRSPACSSARGPRGAGPTPASTTSARSRGCSRGRRRASCCPPGSAWGPRCATPREAHGLELLREMEASWPFFAGLLSNAEMACAKADAEIARRYVELWDDAEPRERIWSAHRGGVRSARRRS